jgi:hypothetical protein
MDNDIQVPDEEKALVKKYAERIKAARTNNETRFKRFEEHRKYYRGVMHKDGSTGLVRTNIIFSTIATIYPQVYARNPDISLTPAESATDDTYEEVKQFGKTAESVLNRLLIRGASLKKRAKSWVRAAMLCQVGWVKLTYQKDIRQDPVIKNRMDDIQDNIERLKALMEKEPDAGDSDLRIAEMQEQINALKPGLEVVVSSGLVIDKLQTEDLLILDPSVRDFDDYVNASALCQQIWMTESQFETQFKRKPTQKATKWYGKAIPKAGEGQQTRGTDEEGFVLVCEIWAKEGNAVYTWCDGEEGWTRDAFNPTRVGKRWYPFFGLCFNQVDGEFYGLSDVELLIELQEEYSRTRTNLSEHRKYTIPIRVVRAGGSLSPEDVDNLKKAKHGDTVVVGGDSAVPLANDVTMMTGAQIDPSLYDVTPIRADIELVSGASDAARGNVLKAKTATEAEIMQQGLVGRTGERQDHIEDVIQEMAEYALQLSIRELTVPEVIKLAGPEAVWPAEPTDEALDTLRLEIRAGSTGKPDKAREREQWLQLMPVLQQAMEKVMALRQAGMNDMADAIVELTRESLRRFDERIDIDTLLPRKKEGQLDPQQMAMELQQAQVMQQQMQEVIGQLQQDLQAAQQELASKQADRDFQGQQGDAERRSKVEVATATANAKAVEGALAEAMTNNKQLQARIDRLEKALQMMPPPTEPIDKNEILLEVRDLIDRMKPEMPEAPEQPVINITVPVTVDGKGQTVKTAKAVKQKDGSFIMQSIETPTEQQEKEPGHGPETAA